MSRYKFFKLILIRVGPIFGSVFQFSHLKLRFFGFGVLCGLPVFSNSVFGFRFLSAMMAVFLFFLSNVFYGFSGFYQGSYTLQATSTAFHPDFLQYDV